MSGKDIKSISSYSKSVILPFNLRALKYEQCKRWLLNSIFFPRSANLHSFCNIRRLEDVADVEVFAIDVMLALVLPG